MIVGVPRESLPGEHRVALIPAQVPALIKAGHSVKVERGAGVSAGYPDAEYTHQRATLVDRPEAIAADLLLQVRAGGLNPQSLSGPDFEALRSDQTIVALCDPLSHPDACATLATKGINLYSLDLMPRITRAQSMDVLSSMATVAGYRATILAALHLPKVFPLLMTAAGTLRAAKVLVLGCGVAGLQAIATARRLGAIVEAYDIRPAGREQALSLGAKLVELPLEADAEGGGGYAKQMDETFYKRQRELLDDAVARNDVVISTAAIPGKPAPMLVSADGVRRMVPGSVIVDLAAERGGNCELTVPGKTIVEYGVTILGPDNLPSEVPYHASQMFSKNVATFLQHLVRDGTVRVDPHDEILRDTLIASGGQIVNPRIKALLEAPAA